MIARDDLANQPPGPDSGWLNAELLAWCSKRLRPPEPFTPQSDLIDSGLLDSLSIIELLVFIEKRFGMPIDNADVSPRNFRTVSAVSSLVAERLSARRENA